LPAASMLIQCRLHSEMPTENREWELHNGPTYFSIAVA
jgi:hypothetical protein